MKNLTLIIALVASIFVPAQAWSSSKLFVGGLAWSTTSDEVSETCYCNMCVLSTLSCVYVLWVCHVCMSCGYGFLYWS